MSRKSKQRNNQKHIENHWTVIILFPIIFALVGLFSLNINDFLSVRLVNEQLTELKYTNYSKTNIGGYVVKTDDTNSVKRYLKGCVLNTNINNPKNETIAITKCLLKIEDIDKNYETEEFAIVSNIIDDKLKISLINNSSLNIRGVQANLSASKQDFNTQSEFEIDLRSYLASSDLTQHSAFDIDEGEIKEIFSLNLDDNMKKLCDFNGWISLKVDLFNNNSVQELFAGLLTYNSDHNTFDVFFSQGDNQDVGFYTYVIDVDNISSGDIIELPITNNISERTVQNVQLILATTKSCKVTFSAQFVINDDKILKTDSYTAKIKVPIYNMLDGPYPYEELQSFMRNNRISNLVHNKGNAKYLSVFYNPYNYFKNSDF